MGWLETMLLIAVTLVIAITAAAGGFWAAVVVQQRKSRARRPFLLGVFCGVMAGVALTGGRQGLFALGAATLKAVIGSPLEGIGRSVDGVVGRALTVRASLVRLGTASLISLPAVRSRASARSTTAVRAPVAPCCVDPAALALAAPPLTP